MKNKQPNNYYDYIIIGSGAAGLHLAMAMAEDSFFKNKQIALFDKSFKDKNDKTYCFWEKPIGKWDNIVSKTWKDAYFKNKKTTYTLNLAPFLYKKINALDFYSYCKNTLSNNASFTLITEKVTNVETKNNKVIVTANQEYISSHLFDSRLEVPLETIINQSTYINQSFIGFQIKVDNPIFNSECFTMMDYSMQWKNSTSFMYILPQSSTEALLEYTFFAPFTLSKQNFENQIIKYIDKNFPGEEYSITATEKGSIPMTDYCFKKHNSKRITKIGTAGGWVKPSTGYSFKFAEKNSEWLVEQLKHNKKPTGYKKPWRFKFYDNLLLKILVYENTNGAKIFTDMYKKTAPELLFTFMDEETSILEEINFIRKLKPWPFIKAIFRS